MEKNSGVSVLIIMIVIFVLVILVAGYFLFAGNLYDLAKSQNQNNNQQQNNQTDQTANWNVYNNPDAGVTFKYPTDFGSKYASFSASPVATITPTGSGTPIDSNGCYAVSAGRPTQDSQVTINGMQFCLSSAGDPGAGQLYNTSNYTTAHNGNYVTLQYVVRTLNGCSPYMGTPDYQPCSDFMNNYASNVTSLIEKSVSTLQFTK